MKIVKIGRFDHDGIPIDWIIDMGNENDSPIAGAVLEIVDDKVCVNGIEIKEWSDARLKAMKP